MLCRKEQKSKYFFAVEGAGCLFEKLEERQALNAGDNLTHCQSSACSLLPVC